MVDKAAIVRRSEMANIHSQKKRILRSERERLENRRYTSAVKTYFRRLEAAVRAATSRRPSRAPRAVSTIDKAVKRGAMHKNTGARKKSRAARVRAAQLGQARRSERRRSASARLAGDRFDRAQRERVLSQRRVSRERARGQRRAAARVQLEVGERAERRAQALGLGCARRRR